MRSLVPLLVLAAPLAAAEPAPKQVPPKPTSHTTKTIEGWTVHVDDRLLAGPDAELGKRAIGALEWELRAITYALSDAKLERLRKVPIWLDRTCGTLTPAQYHPSEDWVIENGYDRAITKCVHIPDAAYYATPRHLREQPWALMHELAHAYHDQVLGFDEPEVKAAWKAFVASRKYKSVPHMNGNDRPHYGLTNQKEFFAEMTEAYVGRNDFYPFNGVELKRAEPEISALMAKIWGPLR
jgi:hypothetical protein